MKFGICNEIFEGWELSQTFKVAREIGYDLVEIAPYTIAKTVTDLSRGQRVRIREAAARAEIAIAGLHWVLAQTKGMYLTHPKRSVRNRTARYFVDLVDCCADLGGTRLIVGSPDQRNVLEGVSHEQAWVWATDCFRDSVKRAEDRGVVICIEPLSPTETNFINTAQEGLRFAGQFLSPAMSIVLDVKAMCSEEDKSIPSIIQQSAGGFEYFHGNDRNRKGPGFGDTDFFPIANALHATGYEGVVSVEVFDFTEGAETIATRSLRYLREVFGRSTAPASILSI